jgi:hypothetical protein
MKTVLRIRIFIIFGSWIWIRIRIRVNSGIQIRIKVKCKIQIRIKVKTQKLWKLKMEQWRAMEQWRVVDAHSGGVEAQKGAEGTGAGFRSASVPWICIKEKRKIRIRHCINIVH